MDYLKKIAEAEKDRIFCLHNLQHFLDVARLAYIMALERKINMEKEIIYAAALVHDIGRWKQYEDGVDHAVASAQLANDLLRDCEFEEKERVVILDAIRKHSSNKDLTTELDYLLYEADKASRLCVKCKSIHQCKRFVDETKPELLY